MRKVVVSEFLSLDGVMEAPDQWHLQFWHDDMGKYKLDELFASDALLLGRRTYEIFAAYWPTVKDKSDEIATALNSLPKYVVSTTLDEPLEWNNSTLIKGNVAEEISQLKEQPGQDILVAGSWNLIRTLMQHDLVDEYRLMVHPIVLGSGKRLFQEGVDSKILSFVDTKRLGPEVVVHTYEAARGSAGG